MKKIILVLVVLTLAFVLVIPAAAGGNGPGGPQGGPQGTPQATPQGTAIALQQKSPRGTFTITGTISAIDTVKQTVTITVSRGNKLIQPYLGTDVTVVTNAKTRFMYKSSTTAAATLIAFTDLLIPGFRVIKDNFR